MENFSLNPNNNNDNKEKEEKNENNDIENIHNKIKQNIIEEEIKEKIPSKTPGPDFLMPKRKKSVQFTPEVLKLTYTPNKKKKLERMRSKNKLTKKYKHFNIIKQYRLSKDSINAVEEDFDKAPYYEMLKDAIDTIYPLIYLENSQKEYLLKNINIHKVMDDEKILYSGKSIILEDDDFSAFILLQGEVHVFNLNDIFITFLNKITLIGYDGPLFHKRLSNAIIIKDSIYAEITQNVFLELIHPFSSFANYLSRNVIIKLKILDNLINLNNYILNSISESPLDFQKVIELYKKTEPCLHQKCNSEEFDFSAWTYALKRLPENVIENYIFILTNKQPNLLTVQDELGEMKLEKVDSSARYRDIYKYLNGKDMIVMRDMESDVLDFITNMCVHYIESTKIREHIFSPNNIINLSKNLNNFEEAVNIFENEMDIILNDDEKKILYEIFGDSFGKKLINLCYNYQDYSISIRKSLIYDMDFTDIWTQNLYLTLSEILNVDDFRNDNDLIIDISQGSKKALLNCISPHIYIHKDEILKWGKENNIKLQTKTFLNEIDELIAYQFYYYNTFPDKKKEKEEMEKKYGIYIINTSFGTGIGIVIVNLNKLSKEYKDPNIEIKPQSKHHILLHIGYTFGKQSKNIIRPILMLFGKYARSLNIIGKAGGLVGNRGDILIANKIFLDKTYQLVDINTGIINKEELETKSKSKIHIGPMLTIAGTILQNFDLLRFYKYIYGCIGLEMEGFYFAEEIDNFIKQGIIKKDFESRFYYYISDIPLDPNQNLSQESTNVSWKEGVGSINAIERNILNFIFGNINANK